MANIDGTRVEPARSIPLIFRILWFIFIGWEVTGIWIFVAWIFNVTVIGLPIGLWMIDRVPLVLTLQTPRGMVIKDNYGDHFVGSNQLPFIVRAIYFLVIGWWASLFWATAGWLLCLTIIGIPFGILMLNGLPAVTTLRRR